MKKKRYYAAIDLGSSNGRIMLGSFDGEKFALKEIHRFPNGPIRIFESLYWDPIYLFSEVKLGLQKCRKAAGEPLCGVGVNSWGVDFVLLDRGGQLLGLPYHYRDLRTTGMMEAVFQHISKEEIFELTGIQFMEINTLFQLYSLVAHNSPLLEVAETFLTISDLIQYWLSGQVCNEFSNATTTQLYDQRARSWAWSLLEKLGIPSHIFQAVVQPGTILGSLLADLAEELTLERVPVIAPVCHDTGSAWAGIPAKAGSNDIFLSSGTWSILGWETLSPVITPEALANNFTNEGGAEGTVRFSKNVMGLWLIQECRRVWAQAGEVYSYDQLASMAGLAEPLRLFIDPDDETFLRPGNMPARIREYIVQTGQVAPIDRESILRCAFESLALKYRWIIERIERMIGKSLQAIHIVGGGAQNCLLCQLTADATGKPVIAGPDEATAFGNIMLQAIALGHLSSLQEGRAALRQSVQLLTYEPQFSNLWEDTYQRFCQLLGSTSKHGLSK